jgi:hypothetical protein
MNVLEMIRHESERLRRLATLSVIVLPAVAALGVLAASASWLDAGRWLSLPPFVPVLTWLVVLGTSVALGLSLRRRLMARATPEAVADAIELEQGLRRGSLTGLMEVADAGVFARFASEQLGARLVAATERPAPRLRRRVVRAAWLSGIALAQVLALATVSWARRPDGWQALLHPIDAWRGALVSPLSFTDAPTRALRGAPVALSIAAPGRTLVQVRWRATGGDWQQVMSPVDAEGNAEALIPSADADLVVLASDGRSGRDSILVRVVDRPFVGDIALTATYPGYLGRADERLPTDAPIRVPAGTQLSVAGAASEPLAQVVLVSEAARVALEPSGARFTGRFTPRQSDVWRWEVVGTSAESLDIPPPLDIEVVADSLPRVEILSPTGEVNVVPNQRVMLELLAQDDQALARVSLRLSRVGASGGTREIVLSERREALWSGAVAAELAAFALTPGDAVQAILVARDAAPGVREAFSAPVILRVPTADQAREAAREAADEAVAAADAAVAAQKELAERTANEARARNDRTEAQRAEDARAAERPNAAQPPREALGFEGAERAREIGEQQRELTSRVNQLEEASRELEDRLREAGALDSGLARQLQDAQRMLREAMTPEMAAALERLESSTQQLDGQRTRQSMADLAAQQQRMRQTLERSAEMLRRAALEGQMQTIADQGRELAQEQRAMADSARAGRNVEPDAARMQREAQQLAQAAQQLSERLEQAQAKPGAEATARGAEQAGQAAQQLQNAGRDPNAVRQAAESMERAAESLSDARGEQVAEWKAELTEALDRSVQEMMQMAREQDALADQARNAEDPSSMRGAQSALQQGVQAAQQRLEEEGRRSTLLSPRSQELMQRAQQRSAQATREASEGRRGQSEQAMREAADALRQAAAQLTRDRERASSARSATGMAELLQQMQQLAQQQGGLNSQMQSLLPMAQQQGARQGMDAATREQARQLARSQREVAQQLDDVADADPSGRAQELAREARALAAALDQGAVDPATQARQERLFRRMLDAGRSLEQDQRDESQRRESRAARAGDRVTPTGDGRGAPAARYAVPTWEELRGLSAEDRRLVIEYFRRLNAAGGTP